MQSENASDSFSLGASGLPVRIHDTRKTIPGLRQAQKYTVRTGGCHNHRSGLYDAILIKGNTSRRPAQSAPEAGATRLLLDNFSLEQLIDAVAQVDGDAELEASGGYMLETLRAAASTGVDFISVGGLTKNVQSIDLSMNFVSPQE